MFFDGKNTLDCHKCVRKISIFMGVFKELYKDFWRFWQGILAVNMEFASQKKGFLKFACGNTACLSYFQANE